MLNFNADNVNSYIGSALRFQAISRLTKALKHKKAHLLIFISYSSPSQLKASKKLSYKHAA